MRKPRILINADSTEDVIIGPDRDGKHWAIYLNPEKYDLAIFCSGSPDKRVKSVPNIRIFRLSKRRLLGFLQLLTHFIFYRWNVILSGKNSWRELILLRLKKVLRPKIRWVQFAISQVPYAETRLLSTRISNRILFEADLLVANSHNVAETIREFKGIEVPVVNGFFDLSLFNPLPHNNKRKVVMCVGSMVAGKQPFLFANIAKETPEADFVWIGERYYFRDMQNKAREEDIHNLSLPGKVDNQELPRLLAEADIFLFPSIHEGFPNAIVEAMACGLPVITFKRFGPEAVVDGETGYVVTTEFEMLEKLKHLLENDDLRATFAQNARKRAFEYDGVKLVKRLENIIDQLTEMNT